MRKTQAALVGGALLLPLALAACGGAAAPPAAPASSTAAAAPGVPTGLPTVGAAAAAARPGKTTTAAPKQDATCKGTDFKADLINQNQVEDGPDVLMVLLALTNNSGRACTLKGAPGFAFYDGAGKQLEVKTSNVDEPGPAEDVTVPAGTTVFSGAKLALCTPSTPCSFVTTVKITPPGLSGAVTATGDTVAPVAADGHALAIAGVQIGTVQEASQGVVAW